MFAKTIIDSDAFLEMGLSAQALYFHLNMRADDDGFVNNPKRIQRMIGAADDDLKILIAKQFIIKFDSGVIVIKHWRINNYLRNDRHKDTVYQEEIQLLNVKDNGAYSLNSNVGIPNVYQTDTQYSIGKDSIGKDSIVENNNIYSGELSPQKDNSSPKFIEIPLNDKTTYPIYEDDIDNWKQLYPAVDVKQEFRKMVGWCQSNPKNRKTKSGINRFINNWLSRQQDKAPVVEERTYTPKDKDDIDSMNDDELLAYINRGE